MTKNHSERAALVALLRNAKSLGLVSSEIRARLDRGDTPSTVLASVGGEGLFAQDTEPMVAEAIHLIEEWNTLAESFVAYFEPEYPQQLAAAFDYPFILFCAGELRPDLHSVAVVGSRSPSQEGQTFTRSLGAIAARNRVTVVSGLARGIDRAAHEAALEAGGRTVAVIGTSLSVYYPPENEAMQRRIAREGLVISQFWPGSRPTKRSFPMRNATMSAYSALTVIVEASEESGTRSQAAAAVRHGRPLILTRPVVASTSWGQRYVSDGYDVTVVSTPEEAFGAIQANLSRSSQIVEWADRLAPVG